MKSVLKHLAAVAAIVVSAVAQDFRIETPTSAVVCRPLLITWTGGEAPYFLSILPGGQPTAPALIDFGTIESGNTFRWVVNIEPNTSLGLTIRDSTGTLAQSAPFNVQPGTDTSCIGQDPSSSSGSSAPPASSGSISSSSVSGSSSVSSPPVSSSSSTIRTTASVPTAPGVSLSRTSSTSPTSSSPAEDDSSASGKVVPAALIGLAGAAVVLLA